MRKFRLPILATIGLLAIASIIWAAGSDYTTTRISRWGISECNLTNNVIDSSPIGATTPDAGKFTTLQSTGLATLASISSAGLTTATGGIKIGATGTPVSIILMFTETVSSDTTNANTTSTFNLPANGTLSTDVAVVNSPALATGIVYTATAGTNVVTVVKGNLTAAPIFTGAGNWHIAVFRKQ